MKFLVFIFLFSSSLLFAANFSFIIEKDSQQEFPLQADNCEDAIEEFYKEACSFALEQNPILNTKNCEIDITIEVNCLNSKEVYAELKKEKRHLRQRGIGN